MMDRARILGVALMVVVFCSVANGVFADEEWTTATGGSNIYKTNTGNVGIGTDNPESALHIMNKNALKLERPGDYSGSWGFFISHYDVDSTGSLILDPSEGTGDFAIRDFNGNTRFYLDTSSGNIGIGTTNPRSKLEINGNIRFTSTSSKLEFYGDSLHRAHILFYNSQNGNLELENCWGSGDANIVLKPDKDVIIDQGNVGIGTTSPQSKLAVNGTITATEVKVTTTGWSDFVFEDSYKLPSLDHVENYIKENKHLPDVPSAEQIAQDGLSMSGMMAKQMQKIEELTLYVIELKKENESLKTQVAKMSELEARMNAMEGKK